MTSDFSDRKHLSWLDKQIRDLIGNGDVSHLPNAGQKLDWSGESLYTPHDMRLAYKMLKDANAAPDWIERGIELDELLEKLQRISQRFRADYEQRLTEAERRGSFILSREADTRWQAAQQRLTELLGDYNSRLLTFNITRPTQIAQRIPLRLTDLLQRSDSSDNS